MTQLIAGANLSATFDEPTDAVTLAVDSELLQDTLAGLLTAGTNVTLTYDDVANTLTIATTALTTEEVDDRVATLIVAGANITKTYDDLANTLTIAASASSGLTDPTTTKGDLLARDAAAVARLPVGADGQVLTADSVAAAGVAWAAAGGGSGDVPLLPKPITGRLYDTGYAFGGSTGTGTSFSADVLRAAPFAISHAVTWDRILFNISTGSSAGGLGRLGIYAAGADGLPGSLVLDAGEIAIDTIGQRLVTINQALQPGLYYLALVQSLAATISYLTSTVTLRALGMPGNNISGAVPPGVTVAHTYGALPAAFGTADMTATSVPRIALRAA